MCNSSSENRGHITIAAVGDIAFIGDNLISPSSGVFKNVRHIFKGCDLVIANLESPLLKNGFSVPGKCFLAGDPRWA
jgi:hypothetical protein